MLITITTALVLVAANPADTSREPFQDLGQQFVDSLRNEDIVEYAQCWISFRRLKAIALASKDSVPKDELQAMKGYFEARNRHVVHSFKVLTSLFKEDGDIGHLKLFEMRGTISEMGGLRKTSMFHVTVAIDAVKYEIAIDDGFEDGGTWYFSDAALNVRNWSNNKLISLEAEGL